MRTKIHELLGELANINQDKKRWEDSITGRIKELRNGIALDLKVSYDYKRLEIVHYMEVTIEFRYGNLDYKVTKDDIVTKPKGIYMNDLEEDIVGMIYDMQKELKEGDRP